MSTKSNGNVVDAEIDFDAWLTGDVEVQTQVDTTQEDEVKEIIKELDGEEEEIVTEEVVVDEAPKEEIKETVKKSGTYNTIVQKLIEREEWSDVDVEIDGKLIPISELDIDEELFFEIKEAQERDKKLELENNYIPVSDFNETNLQIIKVMQKGGDVTQLLNASPMIEKLIHIESERNENDLISLVYQKMKNQEYEDEYIQQKISKLIKEDSLDEEAQKVIDEIKTNYKNFADAELKRIEQEKLEIENKRLEFRKTISEKIKSYKLPDNDRRVILDIATKYDENNVSEAIKVFDKVREEDPERFIDLVMLAKNPKLYSNIKELPIKNEATLNAAKKVISLKPISSTKKSTPEKGEDPFDEWMKK